MSKAVVRDPVRRCGQDFHRDAPGRRLATPLFAVLILIEATDVLFAVESVPAILAISREPFIVFASIAFAIVGLRTLYFLVGGMQGRFRYLNIGLGVILVFVGIKMLVIVTSLRAESEADVTDDRPDVGKDDPVDLID